MRLHLSFRIYPSLNEEMPNYLSIWISCISGGTGKNTGSVNIQFDPDKLENDILDINITVDGESPYGIEAVYRLQEPQM